MKPFVPTSTGPQWRGKIRCSYCKASGYPKIIHHAGWWSDQHGENCANKPVNGGSDANPPSLVDGNDPQETV